MERGEIHIGCGIIGGSNQPLAHAQFVSSVVDYDVNVQAVIETPRFTIPDTGTRAIACRILVESRIPTDVFQQLRDEGHQLRVRKEYSAAMGRGQAVLHDPTASQLRRLRSSRRRVRQAGIGPLQVFT